MARALAPNRKQGKGKLTGREQNKKSKHGRVRQPNLNKLYRKRTKEIDLAGQEFRHTILRPGTKLGPLNLDGIIENTSWNFNPGDPVMHGTLALRRPHPAVQNVHVRDGQQLKLEVKWFGVWREVWRMRLSSGELDPVDGAWSFNLDDDGLLLQESRDDFHYVKSKKKGRPKGWKVQHIMKDLHERFKIPMGKIAGGKRWIKDLTMNNASPMQVIQRIYSLEKAHSGRRYVIMWKNGKLHVLPLRRNPLMYAMHDQIINARLGRAPRDAKFATAVTVRATTGKGKKKHKIVHRFVQRRAVKLEGFIHKEVSGSGVDSKADARAKAKRYVANHSTHKRTASVSHYGIAFVRRGDAIQLRLPNYGYKGKNSIAFIASGTWSLTSGSFTMDLDLGFDDVFETDKDQREAKDKKKRAAKRKKRHGKGK